MEYKSVFDIIGPIMVGPSSSHTAGALEIARYGRVKFGKKAQKVIITLYESFAKTYKGHGTDVALVSGVLGFDANDLRIPRAFDYAKQEQLEVIFLISEEQVAHPNTVKLVFMDETEQLEIVGQSIGGGSYKIVSEAYV